MPKFKRQRLKLGVMFCPFCNSGLILINHSLELWLVISSFLITLALGTRLLQRRNFQQDQRFANNPFLYTFRRLEI